jgi:UDP-N-acetylmuramate dehydrogenase
MPGFDRFISEFGADRARLNAPLAPFTTFKVGGPADCLLEVRGAGELQRAIRLARAVPIPVTVLGGGSNVLVSDAGVRGLVIRVHGGVVVLEAPARIRAEAGVSLNNLVRWMVDRGLSALEAWFGTPGTVGGAVFGNAHYAGRSIGDVIASVRLVGAGGDATDLLAPEMEFSYDASRLQRTGEVMLSALFSVVPGSDPDRLRETARQSLAQRKRTQPLGAASAGCIFRNPDPVRDRVPEGIPPSAGALIDRAGLKGQTVGRAHVSTAHANFILNGGGATASEIRALIERCRAEVASRFGVVLEDEIRYLGQWPE